MLSTISGFRMREPVKKFGECRELQEILAEVGKLLAAYSVALLNSDFWILNSELLRINLPLSSSF